MALRKNSSWGGPPFDAACGGAQDEGAVSKDGRPRKTDGMSAFLYILRCADGSYYVGTTRGSLEQRIAEHQAGNFDGYTARRRPVVLAFQQEFARIEDAIAAERQVKGWRRAKKEALIRGDFAALPSLSRRAAQPAVRPPLSPAVRPSRRAPAERSSG